jgi:acyl transferase domain-containing protein
MKGFKGLVPDKASAANADSSRPLSHNCAAHGCLLAGSVGDGGEWLCSYHFGASSLLWPSITDHMNRAHGPLTNEIVIGLRYFSRLRTGAEDEQRMREAWTRLATHGYDLDPSNCVHMPDGTRRPVKGYRHWVYRAQVMLGSFITSMEGRQQPPAKAVATNHMAHVAEALERIEDVYPTAY